MAREHYRKRRKERIRCKSCGVLFGYNGGRSAKEAILMHIGLSKECNKHYNRRNADGYQRVYRKEGREETSED